MLQDRPLRLPDFINQFEFELVDKIKILGLEISGKADNLPDCHGNTINKITKIVTFWDRFFLSLPGRLNITKTMILSQISYLGCIITPTKAQFTAIKNIIDKFVVGKLNISKDRIYRPPELGGLGMIDISEFIVAQQVTWIKHSANSTRDNWRVDLKRLGNGNVFTIGKENFSNNRFPIFANFCDSLNKFLKAFNSTNDNFRKSYLINNPLLKMSRGNPRNLNLNLFYGNTPRLTAQTLCSLKVNDISLEGRLVSLDEISTNTGLEFNLVTYLRLQEALFTSRNQYVDNRVTDGSSKSVTEFINRFKKGSKTIRKILCTDRCKNLNVDNINNVLTFERLVNILNVPADIKKLCISLWSFNALPMDLREFGFKFYNNTLGLNQRLARFVQGAGAGCTFCRTFNNGPVPDETFIHLFFDCPSVNNILNWLENTFFPDIAFNNRDNRLKFWFFGILPLRNENFSILNLTISQTFLFCIWRCKLQKKYL